MFSSSVRSSVSARVTRPFRLGLLMLAPAFSFAQEPAETADPVAINEIPDPGVAALPEPPAPVEDDRPTHPFDRDWLVNRARELSLQAFDLEELEEGHPLTTLDYDDYRHINFDRNAAIWAREGRQFTIDLFHPGFIFRTPVSINLVVGGVSRRVLYTTDIFEYGEPVEDVKRIPAEGYSGFRIHNYSEQNDRFREFLVFQGASYFRAAGEDQYYGLSSRGIAINTAKPAGEEFPLFTEFWIERPAVDSREIVIHALLESPSLTGAYTFRTTTGETTVMEVESDLFLRQNLETYGIAPLTSMFLFDATNRNRFDDFRPAVHDSDGLLVLQDNGEQAWRPLLNAVQLQASAFVATNPRGFGLMQRHKDFREFEDPEAHYEHRPSLWIEPMDDWGEGHVELIEIPSDKEIYDNIVAYWQPAAPMAAGQRYTYRYRMHWGQEAPAALPFGNVVDTQAGSVPDSNERLFVIDYTTDRDLTEHLEFDVQTSAGTVTDVRGHVVGETGFYRVYLKVDPADAPLAELQLRLLVDGEPWGEKWLYRWVR